MTPGDAFAIANQALKWAQADALRKKARDRWYEVSDAALNEASAKGVKDIREAMTLIDQLPHVQRARAEYISLGRSAGGYRRGLFTICNQVDSKGMDR